MKVLSAPHLDQLGGGESGIHSVIRAYFRHAKEYDIEFVSPGSLSYDVIAIHAGMYGKYPANGPIVAHTHGLYWTADFNMGRWALHSNSLVIDTVRHARVITVPSNWVAETFKRDMRVSPIVIPHGIDWGEWQHNYTKKEYVIGYAKNRAGVDVCNPTFLRDFARRFPKIAFKTTFAPEGSPPNIEETGTMPHDQMKEMVQRSAVFINTTKETWGIAMLEAMASGVPVLAFDHGGAPEIVRHGVTGYLAEPGDYDDLANGLLYCLDNRKILGENGRAVALHEHSWNKAMERVRAAYELAMIDTPPTVSVIIPVYNKPEDELIRALDSIVRQTYGAHEIIVVNDGSSIENHYEDIVESRGARYIAQENKGVANARNRGIEESDGKYIVCLDPDDQLEPQFLEACVPELEADNSLGIAYTGLKWVKPDGSSGISQWPGEFDYDAQLRGRNQIPTACLFRKEAWERVGGYHQRYAPKGCGEEDANLWLRIPSIGYGAKKVTDAGLFVYAWESGYVSGNKNHAATDWRAWLPWVYDSEHPFASVAKPRERSHPVRQYDEPVISIVIPVGANHTTLVRDALDSLEAQIMRKWEVVVVLDMAKDDASKHIASFAKSYPYVKVLVTDKEHGGGAGYARNLGASEAKAPFLLFLDADDYLHPGALDAMLDVYGQTGAAVYTDYVGKAVVDDPSRLAVDLQEGLVSHEDGIATIKFRASDYDCQRAQRQPENPPYIWNNITTLIPKLWHEEVGGFDTTMPSWEDVDYWWRMAWMGKCFVRIPEPLMMYRFNTGNRRDSGLKIWDSLIEYLRQKRNEYDG